MHNSVVNAVFLPLALIWLCGVGQWWARHYFDKLECEITDSTLRYRKGILVQIEKTIPLENIQDVTFIEGPLLRRFNLSVLRFETAGQSKDGSGEMKLIGIIDAESFRQQLLRRREAMKARHASPPPTSGSSEEVVVLLRAILDRLDRISTSSRPNGGA